MENYRHQGRAQSPGEYSSQRRLIVFTAAHPAFGWLSNLYPSEFELHGTSWMSVEHFYQASKTLVPAQMEAIRAAQTPFLAKRLGGSRATTLRPNWETLRNEVMRQALSAKFGQHRELRDKLLATGGARLVEGTFNPHWGAGPDGLGRNQLGLSLMQLRDQIRSNQSSPPGVSPVVPLARSSP